MSADTKWIVGTGVAIISTIPGTGAALAGLLLTQIAGVNARIDDVNRRFDDVNTRIDGLSTRIDRIDVRLDGLDERLRNVEIAFGKVDQRLLTIERVVLPAPAPGE